MELSHAGPMTKDKPRVHGKPGTLPGVGSVSWFGNATFIDSRISGLVNDN